MPQLKAITMSKIYDSVNTHKLINKLILDNTPNTITISVQLHQDKNIKAYSSYTMFRISHFPKRLPLTHSLHTSAFILASIQTI